MKKVLYCLLLLFLESCNLGEICNDNRTIELSGSNGAELNKVIDHYNDCPEKLSAALYIINNMYGHFSQDSTLIRDLQPFYNKYMEVSDRYYRDKRSVWKSEIDSLLKSEGKSLWSRRSLYDARLIKSEWLINEIDRSFIAWKQNKYTQNLSFNNFCQYILPYRSMDGIILDSSRDTFYVRHQLHFANDSIDFRDACDSLLFKYSFLTFNPLSSSLLPIYSAYTFEQVKSGTCEDKAWFNSLLLSSLGMSVTIDFTSCWGNRNGNHTWNSVIIDGITYPFEPFWDSQRWKYKQTYNNETIDYYWGKFRLPKVYRYTYEHHLSELALDRSVSKTDIPPLFNSPFITDVSKEYFKVCDVKVNITERIPNNTKYCYLCVFNSNRWRPVQWGRIEKYKKVKFKDMGMDIVYLPMFYQNGKLVPASSPFYLGQDGKSELIECESGTFDICVNDYTSKLDPKEIAIKRSLLNGARLIGYSDSADTEGELIYLFTNDMDLWNNNIVLKNSKKYRYVRLLSSNYQIALSEVSFFEKDNQKRIISNVRISSDLTPINPKETLDMISDNLSATGFHGVYSGQQEKNKEILFDFGKTCTISSIHVVPYSICRLSKDEDYELFYWDNKWKSAGVKRGSKTYVVFKGVPKGCIYKICSSNSENRIFRYDNGVVNWL